MYHLPDFDIDFFAETRRDEVLNYVYEKYGKITCCSNYNFWKASSESCVKRYWKVLGIPYGQLGYLTKLIPFDPSRQLGLQEYIDDEPKLTEEANRILRLKNF